MSSQVRSMIWGVTEIAPTMPKVEKSQVKVRQIAKKKVVYRKRGPSAFTIQLDEVTFLDYQPEIEDSTVSIEQNEPNKLSRYIPPAKEAKTLRIEKSEIDLGSEPIVPQDLVLPQLNFGGVLSSDPPHLATVQKVTCDFYLDICTTRAWYKRDDVWHMIQENSEQEK